MVFALALSVAAMQGQASDSRDACEILAIVAKEHLGLDQMSAPPLQEIGGGYRPDCDWVSLGLKPFATAAELPNARLMLHRPEIQGRKAKVEVGIIWMSRWGHGSICSLTKHGRRWRLNDCKVSWSS